MTDEITLRSPAPDELRAFFDPLLAAFASDFSEAEFQAERPLLEADRFVSAFVGDERVGSAGALTMRLTVPGGEVAASAITAVGVRPDHTRKGVMRRMMSWLLDDARAHGDPVAVLWASEAAIYQRFGFGWATLGSHFETERSRLVFRAPFPPRDDVAVRMVGIDEMFELAKPVYEALRPQVPGSLDRADARWRELILSDAEWMRRNNGPTYRAVLEVEGEPRGYVIYRVKADWDGRGPKSSLLVVELNALDAESEQRLWQWVCSIDLVSTVSTWRGPVPHPLQVWLQEPRRLGVTVIDGLFLRFVDVAAALVARTYAREGILVMDLEDSLLEVNAGRWRLSAAADGTATMTRTSAAPDLALDVATLACVYLGAYRFGDLARAGLVNELRPGALMTADVLFTPSQAPFCNTMF